MALDMIQVYPGKGMGPFRLGMTRDDALKAAASAGLSTSSGQRWIGTEPSLFAGHQIQLHFKGDLLIEMEVSEPGLPGNVPVLLGDIALLRDGAQDVFDRVRALGRVDVGDSEYPSRAYFPDIGLTLWREGKPGEPLSGTFEAVGVSMPRVN